MGIILWIIAICVIFAILKALWDLLKGVIKYTFYGVICLLGIYLLVNFWPIIIPLAIVGAVIWGIVALFKTIFTRMEERRLQKEIEEHRRANQEWLSQNYVALPEDQISKALYPLVDQIYSNDENSDEYKFVGENIPYGRVNAFLNYHGASLGEEEPYYYSAFPSKKKTEFREYGIVITNKGIYCSQQTANSDNTSFQTQDSRISFAGVKNISISGNRICATKIDSNLDEGTFSATLPPTMSNTVGIGALCSRVVELRLGALEYIKNIEESLRRNQTDAAKKEAILAKYYNVIQTTGIAASLHTINGMYAETKGYMNGSRGGGYAAEYANNTIDRLQNKVVESTAQVLDEHGRQVKGGADRTVDGQLIQTKYYKTARESIGAVFSKGEAIYVDENGRMMEIEVPRDQYNEAVQLLQKRIDRGEVPNVQPGEDATSYVRKGHFTYSQAWNVAKAGTIESLTVDLGAGVVCATTGAGITSVLVFGQAIWAGESIEDAAKAGLQAGFQVLGKGAIIYTVTMQLSRSEFANYFSQDYTKDGVLKGFAGIENPIYNASENIASMVSNSSLARTQFGEAIGLNKVTGKGLIGGTVTAAVVFGPDLCRAMSGRISTEQFLKNSIVGTGGLLGASVGQALIPIPILGGIIGGSIGGFVTKNFMDSFVEDDATKMFQILKEEFLDGIVMAGLTQEELDQVIAATVGNDNLSVILQDMYASGDYREYAKWAIINAAIVNVLSRRQHVTEKMYDDGIRQILLEAA